MKLRTEINIPPFPFKIDHYSPVSFTGSCFSENIASLFDHYGFNVLSNSHGIIYNPVSIAKSIEDIVLNKQYNLQELIEENGNHISLNHHGCFDGPDPSKVIEQINQSIGQHHDFLKKAGVIFITLGTSWVYEWKANKQIVANCHKIPAEKFSKRILSLEEIHISLKKMVEIIQEFSPSLQIVFTLSPVKHLKDGFVENQYSKSLLHAGIRQILREHVFYFPAYEIMQDDLRDYRFWTEDMVHPNELAVQYIWEKFSQSFFTEKTLDLMNEVKKLRQFTGHRSLSKGTEQVKKLEDEKEKKRKELKNKYPFLKI